MAGVPKIVGSAATLLMTATGDAMNNMFDVGVKFPWETSGDGIHPEVSYRCSGFEPPEDKTETYPVTWHGITVQKVKSGINMERKMSLTFRVDATYELYNKFKAWEKVTRDVNTGGVANTASALGQFWVWAPGSEYNATDSFEKKPNGQGGAYLRDSMEGKVADLYWLYDNAQVINVSKPKFSNGASGEKMDYTVEFIFGDVNDPFSTQPKA